MTMRMRPLGHEQIFKAHKLTSQGKRKYNVDRGIPKKREGKPWGVSVGVVGCVPGWLGVLLPHNK